jgi:hypothetical protein
MYIPVLPYFIPKRTASDSPGWFTVQSNNSGQGLECMPYSQEVANVLTPWRCVLRVERIVCCELEDACDGLEVTPGHKLPG